MSLAPPGTACYLPVLSPLISVALTPHVNPMSPQVPPCPLADFAPGRCHHGVDRDRDACGVRGVLGEVDGRAQWGDGVLVCDSGVGAVPHKWGSLPPKWGLCPTRVGNLHGDCILVMLCPFSKCAVTSAIPRCAAAEMGSCSTSVISDLRCAGAARSTHAAASQLLRGLGSMFEPKGFTLPCGQVPGSPAEDTKS